MNLRGLYERRAWMDIGGIPYEIALCGFEELGLIAQTEGGAPTEGLTDTKRALILIDSTVPDRRRAFVLGHEWIHGAFSELGVENTIALFGCKESDAKDAEERLACQLGPIVARAFIVGTPLEKKLFGPLRSSR